MRKDNLIKITELRHALHRIAELSMKERETARLLRDFLRRNTRFQVVDRGGWFYAVRKGTNFGEQAGEDQPGGSRPGDELPSGDRPGGRRIAFRADMDALPIAEDETLSYHSVNAGVSHKCGHDGHCAALCGLALELDERETDADVYLIFQPGEETGSGAVLCRELIRQEKISRIHAFHNLSGYPEGSVVYRPGLTQPASEGVRLYFAGKASHASAPEDGRNPSELIARVILRAAELSEDQSAGMMLCTVTGVRLGAGDFGISPGDGELSMTLRAEEESRMKRLEKQILAFAAKEGQQCGIGVSASVHDYFPETRNDDACLTAVVEAAEEQGLTVIRMEQMWRASEDFGWYLKECPGAIFYIGSGEEHPPLHTAEYDFNDRILETAADLFAALV